VAVLLIATMAGGERAQARTLFTLTGHGWGHGVGLSQWGADGYAQHGWGYRRILAHYYTGTGLGTLRPGAHERRDQYRRPDEPEHYENRHSCCPPGFCAPAGPDSYHLFHWPCTYSPSARSCANPEGAKAAPR